MRKVALAVFLYLMPVAPGWAQSFNATISGSVTDPSNAVIPKAEVTLTALATGVSTRFTTGADGLFRFPNLQRGDHELRVTAAGFKEFVQRGIRLNLNDNVRLDVRLELGTAVQEVQVEANASPLNFENAELKQAVNPAAIQELPLIVSGNQRAAASLVLLVPGVSTGPNANPRGTMINGSPQHGEEAVLDGVSMQQGALSQGGLTSMFTDYPITPDAVSEVSVLTSNFEAQYGSTSGGVVVATTKSGTNELHGSAFEFLRNNALNARQFGTPTKSKNIENDLGANLGGPARLPLLWGGKRRTYFFFAFGRYYVRGAPVAPVLSIPSLKQRQGDFSDWVDSSDRLIPVYDPATTRRNPNYDATKPVGSGNLPFLADQFMGCDGRTPNVICPSDPRLRNSLANQWLKFLPQPTFPTPINNYVAPAYAQVGGVPLDHKNSYDARIDHWAGDKDHLAWNIHYHYPVYDHIGYLPQPLTSERFITGGGAVGPWVHRVNWDHTFAPTLLNNTNFGYLNFRGYNTCVNADQSKELPQISGVGSHATSSSITFQEFTSYGCTINNQVSRPTVIVNDLATWIRGKHTVKFGGEYRYLQLNRREEGNAAGTFNFARAGTGLPGVNSGNAVASFLLEQVNSASAAFRTVPWYRARQREISLHAGDAWRVTSKLSISYGLRWDQSSPSVERDDNLSFFDAGGVNPSAGNRLGRLAFAGNKWGAASYGKRHPEETYYRAFAPRLGIAYSLGNATVIRAGYGVFYSKAYYSNNAAMSLSGFNSTPSFSSSNSGTTPAFILSQGFPQNFPKPPFVDAGFLNGQSAAVYRPSDANRLPYSQQWNFTIERQFTGDLYASAAYVGTKGTRLVSRIAPLNAIDPKFLSLGQRLNDQFAATQTSLNGVPAPYAGWAGQMRGCPPTVAQALRPYPQYCDEIQANNENAGNSTYHSFQLKVEKRYGSGLWLLGSYTLSKMLTDADSIRGGGPGRGDVSPFERQHNKTLSWGDVPQVFSLAWLYQLPAGKGKAWLNRGGVADKVFGGWGVSSIFRASSGTPIAFTSGRCNVPGQFSAGCIPGVLPGANPWAQDKSQFNPDKPLFNIAAFESVNSFDFYYGKGSPITNLRGFGYVNHDVGVLKNSPITEKISFQFRAEFFNIWNLHTYNTSGFGMEAAFNTNIASPSFGMWTGAVTPPRNIQLGMKVMF